MAVSASTVRPVATIQYATTPTIYNVSVPSANTEVSLALSPATKMFTIRVRGMATLKLAYISGDSGILYLTIPAGTTREVVNLNFNGTLYFQTNKPTQIVEIEEWV